MKFCQSRCTLVQHCKGCLLQLRSAPSFFWTRAVKRGGNTRLRVISMRVISSWIVLPPLSPVKTSRCQNKCRTTLRWRVTKTVDREGFTEKSLLGLMHFASFRTAQVNAVALSTALAACEVAGRWEIALQLIAERAEILVTWEQQDLWSLYWPLSHFSTLRRWPSDVFDGLQLWMNLSMPGTVST